MKQLLPFFGQLADVATTLIGMSMGFTEMNPLMAWLLDTHWGVFLGFKLAVGYVFVLASIWKPRMFLFTCAVGFVPALWNLFLILGG